MHRVLASTFAVFSILLILQLSPGCGGKSGDDNSGTSSSTGSNTGSASGTSTGTGSGTETGTLTNTYTGAYAGPKMPVGMNIPGNVYYTKCLIFNDVMKTASWWITYNASGPSDWDTGLIDEIPLDVNGYPTEMPYTPSGESAQKVRFLINNYYSGRYVILFDGEGSITVHSVESQKVNNNKYYIDLTGAGGHVWIDIDSSTNGNHIRNMRIIPEAYEDDESSMPTFYDKFLEGLAPFHALRFMDWMETNNSRQESWSDRSSPTYYSQGMGAGMAIEYAIELSNILNADAWFCVPHRADDDYITNFATMVRDNLDPSLKVYVEYSNEVWNWIFDQAHYVVNNAPDHHNQYVVDNLSAINPSAADHPEKDAYMMQRVFRLWSDVFTGANASRLVRVATGQQSWVDNSRRILKYLFKTDQNGDPVSGGAYDTSTGAGCDAFAVTAYFNFTEDDHNAWNAMDPSDVTPSMICDAVIQNFNSAAADSTAETAGYVNRWGVDYMVYEGGQHMQPWQQGEWDYNQSLWDAQVHVKMYDLYRLNFESLNSEALASGGPGCVNCRMFMAFSYVSERESRWGSWGHLESMEQVGSADYMSIAPKYRALLDANSSK